MDDAEVYVEDWGAMYGSPYLVTTEEAYGEPATLVEDGPDTLAVHGPFALAPPQRLAFVDGVRRGEATLYLSGGGTVARGVAGAHGSGTVLVEGSGPLRFERCSVQRLAIFGSGRLAELPEIAGGWAWESRCIADPSPDAPLQELQNRMRQSEVELAEELCADGWVTVVDGPLSLVRSRDLPVIGYVKTHHQPMLPPERHAEVPRIAGGQRTSLFLKRAKSTELYSCYLRLLPRTPTSGPWAGIVRIELPASVSLATASATADQAASLLPRYAGVAHVDPRAPQNLQPIGALERQLRHHLGDPALAVRAVREAVRSLRPLSVGGTA